MTLQESPSLNITTDGATVRDLHVKGRIVVKADDVTIERVRVTGDGAVLVRNTGRRLVLRDMDLVGQGPECAAAVGFAHYTATRLDVSGCSDGFAVGTSTTVEDSYVHDLAHGNGHNDDIQVARGKGIVIRGNTLVATRHRTSAIMIKADKGAVDDVVVERNRLGGGNFTMYVRRAAYDVGNIRVRDNVFVDPGRYGRLSTDVPVTWSNNVDGNGDAVTPAQPTTGAGRS